MIFLRSWLTYVVQISMDSGLQSCFFSTTRVHLLDILSLSHGSWPHAFTSDPCVLPLSYKTKQNMNTSTRNEKVALFLKLWWKIIRDVRNQHESFRHLPTKLWIFTSSLPCLHSTSSTGGAACAPGRPGCPANSVIEDAASGRLWIVASSDRMYRTGGWWCECCGFSYSKSNIKFSKTHHNYKSKRLWNSKTRHNFKSKRSWNLTE